MSNLQAVQEIYAAFGRGDVPAILARLADDVEWEYAYRTAPNPIPWLQPRKGRDDVKKFFQALQRLEIHTFNPKTLLEGPQLVVALTDLDATVKDTGRRIVETDETHLWHFNDAGKVVRFRHCADTYQHLLAYGPETKGADSTIER